jgi:16S rRNA G1207 methylase RsmC
VVELGCGAAVAGVTAARYASRVYLTDGDEASLGLAKATVGLNAESLRAEVMVCSLPWGRDAVWEIALGSAQSVHCPK